MLNAQGVGVCKRVEKAGNAGFACMLTFCVRTRMSDRYAGAPDRRDVTDYECTATAQTVRLGASAARRLKILVSGFDSVRATKNTVKRKRPLIQVGVFVSGSRTWLDCSPPGFIYCAPPALAGNGLGGTPSLGTMPSIMLAEYTSPLVSETSIVARHSGTIGTPNLLKRTRPQA